MHVRLSGGGLPLNWIVADILRIENGKLVEHWDVIQDEATEEQSKEQGTDVRLILSRLFRTGENKWIACSSLQ